MPKTLQLEMVTPEKSALKTDAEFVVLPSENGELGVLPGHEPYWVALHGGEVRVTTGGDVQSFAIGGGFAEIMRDRVSIFAEAADLSREIDVERERQAIEKAKAETRKKDLDPTTLAAAEAAIQYAQVKLRVAEMRGRRGRRADREAP